MNLSITVPGEPIAQPRQRHRVIPGQAFAHNYTPSKSPVNEYKAAIRLAYAAACSLPPLAGPVSVHIDCWFSRPQSHYRTGKRAGELKEGMPLCHTAKPDAENVAKAILDALSGLAYKDDKQVAYLNVSKCYGERPCTHISIRKAD